MLYRVIHDMNGVCALLVVFTVQPYGLLHLGWCGQLPGSRLVGLRLAVQSTSDVGQYGPLRSTISHNTHSHRVSQPVCEAASVRRTLSDPAFTHAVAPSCSLRLARYAPSTTSVEPVM